MQNSRQILMVMPHMTGGGAERVAAQLMNQFNARGYDTCFVLTSARREEVIRTDLNEKTELILLTEELNAETASQKLAHFPARINSTVFGKLFEALGRDVPAAVGKATIDWQYHRQIRWLREYMRKHPDMTVIAFLQPAIPMTLLAARGLPNRVIISERADPNRLMKKRYGRKFIERYYTRADAAVFQTRDAQQVYPACVAEKGVVIPNPLKTGLPEPYKGERNRTITTFCRISKQKNLPVLIDAFALLHKEYADYRLRIIGDAPNAEGEEVLATIKTMIADHGIGDAVRFEPFSARVHELILADAMYVNSSDYEGISNAMLEAMAIGMPVVCTDCPIGGARATITDGENGLLVPIQNAGALYRGMERIIEDETLARKIAENASALRESLSLDAIADRWLALL